MPKRLSNFPDIYNNLQNVSNSLFTCMGIGAFMGFLFSYGSAANHNDGSILAEGMLDAVITGVSFSIFTTTFVGARNLMDLVVSKGRHATNEDNQILLEERDRDLKRLDDAQDKLPKLQRQIEQLQNIEKLQNNIKELRHEINILQKIEVLENLNASRKIEVSQKIEILQRQMEKLEKQVQLLPEGELSLERLNVNELARLTVDLKAKGGKTFKELKQI